MDLISDTLSAAIDDTCRQDLLRAARRHELYRTGNGEFIVIYDGRPIHLEGELRDLAAELLNEGSLISWTDAHPDWTHLIVN